jgi:hypothetical protein
MHGVPKEIVHCEKLANAATESNEAKVSDGSAKLQSYSTYIMMM